MDKQEILLNEQNYYREIRAGIQDIIHHELGRLIIIVIVVLLLWLGSWMVWHYLKDNATQPISEQKEAIDGRN